MRLGIIYYSSTGNTEEMAELIAEGARKAGSKVDVLPVSQCDRTVLASYDILAFGCPASGQEELDDLEFLPFYETIESDLNGRKVAIFGSFGWGDGQWIRDWEERVKEVGADLFESGLAVQEEPGPESDAIRDFGYRLVTD